MKETKFLKIVILAFGMATGGLNALAQVNITPIRTDFTGFSDWTDTNCAGTTYVQILTETSTTISPVMNFNSFTAEKLNFKARTYGGVTPVENEIFVAVSTDNGSTWTDIGSRTPTSSTMTAVSVFDLSTYNGTQIKVKFYVKGTNATVGAGIDDITFTGIAAPTCNASNLAFATSSINKTEGNPAFSQIATSLNASSPITYSSSVPTVASVNASTGEVTVGVEGSAIITASQSAGTFNAVDYCASTATYTVIVAAAPCNSSNLAFAVAEVNKVVGDVTFTQTANSQNLNSVITYSSSAPTVATVDANTGAITLGIVGSAIITANQAKGNGFCASTARYTINIGSNLPTITLTDVTDLNFVTTIGSENANTLTVSGTKLTANINIALSGTNADQFSISESLINQTNGIAPNTGITVKYKPTNIGNHTATLTFSSTGAIDIVRTLTASSGLEIPIATMPSNLKTNSFIANWNNVPGVSEYQLDVYTKYNGGGVAKTETEAFNGITPLGNLISKATYLTGWSVYLISATRQIYTTAGNYGTASPSLAFTATGDYIQTATYDAPIKSLSFWAKQQSGATSSTLIEGYNGTAWSSIATLSNADIATAAIKKYDLVALGKTDIVKLKLIFTKVSGGISIDDIVVNSGGITQTPITGSPFTIIGANSKELLDLPFNNIYYYTVIAKNGAYSTVVSNEMSASLSTGLSNPKVTLQVMAQNGNILVMANEGDQIEIYNAIGQKLLQKSTSEGLNKIAISAKGVVLVKIGNRVGKVIL